MCTITDLPNIYQFMIYVLGLALVGAMCGMSENKKFHDEKTKKLKIALWGLECAKRSLVWGRNKADVESVREEHLKTGEKAVDEAILKIQELDY